MRDFCSYFDSRYLPQALALADSLRRHCERFRLWALCLDDASYRTLQGLAIDGIVPISLEQFERGDDALQRAKSNRSPVEYYFTCTPSLPLFVLRAHPDVVEITYLDADVFFFSSPEALFDEIRGSSVAIVPHRFPESMRVWERCGVYNVGWLTFRRDEHGLACLHWWRDRCLEWCHDRVEPDRFADQKYLDDWPQRFRGVHVIRHAGANVASWNLANYRSTGWDGERVLLDESALIFYHFHHVKPRRSWLFETDFHIHRVRLTDVMKQRVFTPYLRSLDRQRALVARLGGSPPTDSIRPTPAVRVPVLSTLSSLAAGHMLVYVGGRVR